MAQPTDEPDRDPLIDELLERTGAAWPASDEELDRWLAAQPLAPDEKKWIGEVIRKRTVEARGEGAATPAPAPASRAQAVVAKPRTVSRLSADDLARLDRQLLELVESGIPLPEGLRAYGTDLASGKLGRVLDALRQDLEAGLPLSEAIERRGAALPRIYKALVAAGEASGDIQGMLSILARQAERDAEIGRRLREALAGPVVALTATTLLAYGLFTTVIPQFAQIFESMNVDLPAPTELLLATSDVTSNHYVLVGIGTVLVGLALARFLGPWVRGRLPGIVDGRLRARTLSELSRALSGFLGKGMPAAAAFQSLEAAYGDSLPKGTLARVCQRLEGGETVASALRPEPAFPPTFVWFVGAAESQGNLPLMLDDLATDYDRRFESSIRRLEAWLVPAGVAVVGVFVGFVVLSLFLPIFKLQSSLMQ